MELSNTFFDSYLTSFGNFVQVVSSSNDENKKTKLVEQLNQFLEITSPLPATKKRSNNFELKVPDKKIKLATGRMDVPNEIWTKIMNYLPTNCIFKNFGLVSKKFHSLTSGIKYLHCKLIYEHMSDTVLKIVKKSRGLIALSFEVVNSWYSHNEVGKNFLLEAINSCQSLKSLKVNGDFEIKMNMIEILQKFGPQLQHLAFENNIRFTPGVLIELSKFRYLKSLGLSVNPIIPPGPTYQANIHSTLNQTVQNLVTFATQLESIDLKFKSFIPSITNIYNQLIYEKRDTLKKVGLTNTVKKNSLCNIPFGDHCNSFETINECKNLEELSGYLHPHEFQNIQSKLKRLFTVKISHSDELSTFAKINCINLEHIEIVIDTRLFARFAKMQFPALKYLLIELKNNSNHQISLNHENLKNLVKNSPNLRAIRFKGKPYKLSKEFMLQIFETKGIIISVNDGYQEDFEMADYFYKNQKGYQLFEKYKALKTLYWKQFSDAQQ